MKNQPLSEELRLLRFPPETLDELVEFNPLKFWEYVEAIVV
jgi:hypothetical protein